MSDNDIKQTLSPTAAHVYDHLRWADGALTIQELSERTGRHPQTIREARHELVDAGIVTERWSNTQPRQKTLTVE